MSRDRASLSRRRLLGSVGTVGALSGVAGVGTWALFEDGETFAASVDAGEVGVSIGCDSCPTEGDSVSFGLDGLEPGDERIDESAETFTVTADANPVRVWLRTNCPDPVDPLGDAVEVRLSRDPDCDGSGTTQMYPSEDGSWRTLNEFRSDLRGGLRLDNLGGEPCLDGTLCLDLEYRLPEDATWANDLSTELTFEVAAEQCRHVPEDSVTSPPFPPSDCRELDCPYCVELGKLEVGEDDLLPPGVYDFTELCPQFADDGTAYKLEVLEATNKEDDDGSQETVCARVRLLAGEDEDALEEANAPPICSVAVKGSQTTETYDVDPASTRTRGDVCTGKLDEGTEAGGLSAISNIVVSVCSENDTGDCFGPPDSPGGSPRQDETSEQRVGVSD
ncbi:hypothetical protein [Haloarchaeobius iranensis]|uniref:SipW-cognate class signal peptide n=1 Tax=Haloarchaeobius iranensis TaxID=996166 RepID=A0A1G9YFV0_9EURY|nr:hypothetical protein [Haloarchaeobius iranensis]SDN08118.1 hypothetical protein SAMN05192554_11457 [Haloarchaeobius iranensis]